MDKIRSRGFEKTGAFHSFCHTGDFYRGKRESSSRSEFDNELVYKTVYMSMSRSEFDNELVYKTVYMSMSRSEFDNELVYKTVYMLMSIVYVNQVFRTKLIKSFNN